MVEMHALLQHPACLELNSWKLPMTALIEPINQALLEVTVSEGLVDEDRTTLGGISDVQMIEIKPESPTVKFNFLDFVTYAVTAEMYATDSATETYEGGWFSVVTQSHLLAFVGNATWATSDFPGPLHHYQIRTLDHRIDVVTAIPPQVDG